MLCSFLHPLRPPEVSVSDLSPWAAEVSGAERPRQEKQERGHPLAGGRGEVPALLHKELNIMHHTVLKTEVEILMW